MVRARTAVLAGFALALTLGGPLEAQTPMEDPLDARDARRVDRMEKVVRELRAIIFQMRDTGKPVVVQPADTDARMAELTRRLGDLETTLRSLNGALDDATRELDAAKREIAGLKAETKSLGERLGAVEAKAAEPPPTATTETPLAQGDPAQDFTQARQLMLAGDYDAAEAAFAAYVVNWPDAPRTAEASYWWGKTLGVRAAHADAAKAYIGAIRGWPQTPWAPDAVVELSRSLIALKKPADACQTLAEFTRRYPKAPTNVAGRAAQARTQAKCAA